MKPKELLITGFAYLVGITVVYFISRGFYDDAAGLSQAVGTILAVFIASYLYQSRNPQPAPAKVKFSLGLILAVLAVVQGLSFQQLFHWMRTPDIAIGAAVVGGLIFPFALWNTLGNSVSKSRKL